MSQPKLPAPSGWFHPGQIAASASPVIRACPRDGEEPAEPLHWVAAWSFSFEVLLRWPADGTVRRSARRPRGAGHAAARPKESTTFSPATDILRQWSFHPPGGLLFSLP